MLPYEATIIAFKMGRLKGDIFCHDLVLFFFYCD